MDARRLLSKSGARGRQFVIAETQRLLSRRELKVARVQASNGEKLDVLSLLIERVVGEGSDGVIVQVGANDGLVGDPIRAVVLSLGTRALLVEPLPDMYEQLIQNYAGHDHVQFCNAAVGSTDGSLTIFRVDPAKADLPPWVQGTATSNRKILESHALWLGDKADDFIESIIEVAVPVISFGELLRRFALQPSDVVMLQIDTEGSDDEVLASAWAEGCRPALVNYEHKHLSTTAQFHCRQFLSEAGYKLLSDESDTLAYLPPERR